MDLDVEDPLAVYVNDTIKIEQREDVESALDIAKQATWDVLCTDKTPGVCGAISSVCFRTRHASSSPLLPSIALLKPFTEVDDSLPAPKNLPQVQFSGFSTSRHRSIEWEGVRLALAPGTSVYGMGENAGGLLLNDMAECTSHKTVPSFDGPGSSVEPSTSYPRSRSSTVCWATDACFYNESHESLYQAHPWAMCVRPDGSTFGIFVDSTYRTIMHLCHHESDEGALWLYLLSEAPLGPAPIYIINALSPQGVVIELARLTGTLDMPPRWALGYQQCRWSYFPDKEVKRIADTFREKQIPCDVIWMDIHYMDGYRCFTFDPSLFPDPEKLNQDLHDAGFKSVYMIDPGIKHGDSAYGVYTSGSEGNHWITKSKDENEPYVGAVWPGATVFPDFTAASTREWWAGLFGDYMKKGIDGVWNDMNEVSSFQTGGTIPIESFHHADEALGGPDSQQRYHNVYGMLMTRASHEGVMRANPDKRPFVLTRSNFTGGQRYAACWTGDNGSSWKHLHFSIPMVLNLGLSGQPFAGIDIGGFFHDASPELYARWMGLGTLLPFARGHTCQNTVPHEPWSFGQATEDTCRRAIQRRYVLLPYLYSLFYEASISGLPVARPLFFADPSDPALRNVDNSFLLGADLLIHAITVPAGHEKNETHFPNNHVWRNLLLLNDPAEATDDNLPQLFQRAGSILPLGPVVQYTEQEAEPLLKLSVMLNQQGCASGRLYEDAGEGYGYKNNDFAVLLVEAISSKKEITITSRLLEGTRSSTKRKVEITVITFAEQQLTAHAEGSEFTSVIQVM